MSRAPQWAAWDKAAGDFTSLCSIGKEADVRAWVQRKEEWRATQPHCEHEAHPRYEARALMPAAHGPCTHDHGRSAGKFADDRDPPLWCPDCGAVRLSGSLVWDLPITIVSGGKEFVGDKFDVDGFVDEKGIHYIGLATRRPNGKWVCLADVEGALCLVEVNIRLIAKALPL